LLHSGVEKSGCKWYNKNKSYDLGCACVIKTSIRFFEDIPVRAVWEDDTSKWWFCASDIAEALTKSSNPRSYWNALKRRKGEEMSDSDYVQILKKTQKELFEEKDAFEKAGRADTVLSLNNQIAAIEKYLPKMMSEDEIRAVIMTLPDKSVPSVMRHFKAEYAGKCDMAEVNKVLRSL